PAYCYAAPPRLHPFPTRRSSDLEAAPVAPEPEPVTQPKPEPEPKPEVKEEVKPDLEPPQPKVDIALEQEKKRKEEERKQKLAQQDRKSTRLNSSHVKISYAVFCL